MSSSFGTLFKVSTFGESHCAAVGGIVDGCPSKIELSEQDIQPQLDRRRPGQSDLSTPRSEKDQVQILSGVENGMTLGTAIAFMVFNKDQRPGDYKEMAKIPRPSHADFTYQQKYGVRASSGGGRASARETIARVCAGAIAEKVLKLKCGIEIVAWVSSVGNIQMPEIDFNGISRNEVDADFTRCPDMETAKKMENLILETKQQQDSVGGVISCVIRNCPAGLGEPVFEKFEALLAQAMLSIPASKGFEIGSGFAGSRMTGSQHNDMFVKKGNKLGTVTNLSGGVQGGITNGEPVYFNVAFKPPATIGRQQETSDFEGNPQVLESKGRHDPCVAARAVPVVESMAAIVTADCFFRQQYRI